jgi:lipopolysaccharide transport system ATP-binding protein
MTTPIVEINHISKCYQIGALKEPYLSLRDEIMKWLPSKIRKARNAQRKFWALDDVSFNIMEGDTVGIIGRNGAGKSTLLKILSQITPPTKGTITMRGRVASLLEVGTGFHPELTGRENIFLNGAILGMRRKEIKSKFDEIIAFAEVERFLDTPVKRYSSGMYVRLAFAVTEVSASVYFGASEYLLFLLWLLIFACYYWAINKSIKDRRKTYISIKFEDRRKMPDRRAKANKGNIATQK